MTVLEQHKAISFCLAILDRQDAAQRYYVADLLESEAAEALRAASDSCWKNMTEEERKEANRFAGSLE